MNQGLKKMLDKIVKCLYSVFLIVYFLLKNLLVTKACCFNKSSKVHLVLTTYNARLGSVYLTIETLLSQSNLYSSITLWLSKEDIDKYGTLPKTLLRQQKRGLVIKVVNENIKSYKKLFYEYKERADDSGALLITVDDDVFYPRNFVDKLLRKHDITKQIVCFRAKVMKISIDSDTHLLCDVTYEKWPLADSTTNPDDVFPTGVGGVLYPISSLKGLDTQKDKFLELCPNADDVWFKFLTKSNGYRSYLVSDFSIHPLPIIQKSMKGLELQNVNSGQNNIQIVNAIKYFGV